MMCTYEWTGFHMLSSSGVPSSQVQHKVTTVSALSVCTCICECDMQIAACD